MKFSDESYDVDIIRKAPSSQTSRADSSATPISLAGSKDKFNFDFRIDPLTVPRFARTLKSYQPEEESRLLAFEADRSLVIFNEESPGYWIARDVRGKTGLVSGDHLEFYDGKHTSCWPLKQLSKMSRSFGAKFRQRACLCPVGVSLRRPGRTGALLSRRRLH